MTSQLIWRQPDAKVFSCLSGFCVVFWAGAEDQMRCDLFLIQIYRTQLANRIIFLELLSCCTYALFRK